MTGNESFAHTKSAREDEFFKFFVLNFKRLSLKRLLATCYAGSPIAG